MKSGESKFFNLLSFIAIVIIGILALVNNLLPIFGIKIEGMLFAILQTIQHVITLVVIGYFGYNFVANKTKTWKIIYWVAIILFVAAIVIGFFR